MTKTAGRENQKRCLNRAASRDHGTAGSDSQAWVMLRIGRSAVQSHKRKEPVDEENKVCRIGCPCRDNFDSCSGAGRGDTVAGGHIESRRIDSETGEETGAGGGAAVLL